jgi:hypothetical protein
MTLTHWTAASCDFCISRGTRSRLVPDISSNSMLAQLARSGHHLGHLSTGKTARLSKLVASIAPFPRPGSTATPETHLQRWVRVASLWSLAFLALVAARIAGAPIQPDDTQHRGAGSPLTPGCESSRLSAPAAGMSLEKRLRHSSRQIPMVAKYRSGDPQCSPAQVLEELSAPNLVAEAARDL